MTAPALSGKSVAILWTKFLPYHVARIRHLRKRLLEIGWRLTAIEVASKDALYPFPETPGVPGENYICLFSGKSYRALSASKIHAVVLRALSRLQPDVVFAPSTPFPSGMAAIKYCLVSDRLSVMMDDAWECSDRRGWIVSQAKTIIHNNVDVAFVPAESHASYYVGKGFPKERIVCSVDVVDNDFYARGAAAARSDEATLRAALGLPERYFLFVGRFIRRKGLTTLLEAYRRYSRAMSGNSWGLVLVGEGEDLRMHETMMAKYPLVKFVGGKFGEEICPYYALAGALVLPSEVETWGLVVNEAMASGLPVIVSKGVGAGRALVEEGRNGWTFEPGDAAALALLMERVATLSDDERRAIKVRSEESVGRYTLDTFADSAIRAANMPRRERRNLTANLLTKFWTGRISFYP